MYGIFSVTDALKAIPGVSRISKLKQLLQRGLPGYKNNYPSGLPQRCQVDHRSISNPCESKGSLRLRRLHNLKRHCCCGVMNGDLIGCSRILLMPLARSEVTLSPR